MSVSPERPCLGLDIARDKVDACLLTDCGHWHTTIANTAAGFARLQVWLAGRKVDPAALHACMEATGNYGLDLAECLHQAGITVSIVNPLCIKAFGASELSRNKTDKLDAALIARFCAAMAPPAWTPPAAHIRLLRELTRRCAALKAMRVQELNRQKAGAHGAAVGASVARMLQTLDAEIAQIMAEVRAVIAGNAALAGNLALLLSIPGLGEVTAALMLAELPNIATFTPKGLAAFAGLSPQEHSSGTRLRRGGISRIGHAALRSALYLCALSARRYNPTLKAVADRMHAAGKPPRVILVAVARRLLVTAHTVIRKQESFRAEMQAA